MKNFRLFISVFTVILITIIIGFSFVTDAAPSKTLSRIKVNPSSFTITGFSQESRNLSTIAYYSDGSTQDITNSDIYSSSDSEKVYITQDSDGNKYFKSGTKKGTAYITAVYNGKTSKCTVVVKPKLTGISFTPASKVITGRNVLSSGVAVKALYEDASAATVTNSSKFTSSDSDIAFIINNRIKSGTKYGTAEITASYQEKTAVCSVTVNPVLLSISITPSSCTITGQNKTGEEVRVTALYDDDSTKDVTASAALKTSSSTIVSVIDGFLTSGSKSGKATVTATYNKKTAACTVTVVPILVSISASPASSTISYPNYKGSAVKITAAYSDAVKKDVTSLCTFESSNSNIAYVENKTLKSGSKSGTAIITARYENKQADITVTAKTGILSVSLSPSYSRIFGPNSSGQKLTLTAYYSDDTVKEITTSISYKSSNTNIVTVSKNVLKSGKNSGMATITATYSKKTATCEVTVTPLVSKLSVSPSALTIIGKNTAGKRVKVNATYSDGSSEDITEWAAFTSNNAGVAYIEDDIIKSGSNNGTAVITASFCGKSTTLSVDVPAPPIQTKPVNIIRKEIEKKHGKTSDLTVPSYPSTIEGTNSAGGYLTIVSSFPDGFSLDVSPKVMFNTSDGNIAYVKKDSNGNRILVSGDKTGTATITAIYGGKIVSFQVTVVNY